MQLVNSIRQYTAIIKHCPNIIRAIVSIQGDAFDCRTLYRTRCTTRCSTCIRFGNLIDDCRRVCLFCFSERPEYFPSHVTKHTSSSPPMQSHIAIFKLFTNFSSWQIRQACPGDTVLWRGICGRGGFDSTTARQ